MESTSLELVLDETLDWQPACEHSQHKGGGRYGHSDESPVLVVEGKSLPCCGHIAPAGFLCESWWNVAALVSCPACGEVVELDDCYSVIGRA